ncbi:MAG: tetratricopeptide repeat protein, partial [Planctomycetota bacterium]
HKDEERLYYAVRGADRLVLHLGGSYDVAKGVSKDRFLLEIRSPEEFAAFVGKIRVHEFDGEFSHCECGGNPSISFYEGEALLASISCHHFRSLRWEGWRSDMTLQPGSEKFLRNLCLDLFPRILELLRFEQRNTLGTARDLITEIGKPAVPKIIEAFGKETKDVRFHLIRVFHSRGMEDPRILPVLVDVMEKESDLSLRLDANGAHANCLENQKDERSPFWKALDLFRDKKFGGYLSKTATLPKDVLIHPWAKHLRSIALFKTGKQEEALRLISSLIHDEMASAGFLFWKGRLLLGLQRPEEALSAFKDCRARLDREPERENLVLARRFESGSRVVIDRIMSFLDSQIARLESPKKGK